MKARIDALDAYLKDVVKLQSENYKIYIEKGSATAVFNSDDQFLFARDDAGVVQGVVPTVPDENFHMINDYSLALHVQNYGGDYDALIRLVLFWLNDHMQGVTLEYVMEHNNNSTVDIWFDLAVSEGSKNDESGGVHTC